MTFEWQSLVLGNVCSKIGSGATPRGGKEAYRGGATALIRSQNIHNDRFVRDGLVFIDDEQAAELRNVVVERNDVLLNITGDSVARCCQVTPDVLPARVNQHVAIIRPKADVLDSRFLRYSLVSSSMQAQLLALASAGATRNALTKGMIETLVIKAPQIEEQHAIAEILGALDDRIDNLRQINTTLEAIAAALFKSRFVNFDGVPPGDMQESEVGLIPKGWRVASFEGLLEGSIGGDWGKEKPEGDEDQPVCIIRGTDFPDLKSGGKGGVPTRYTSKKKLASRILQAGDIVIEVSGGSPKQPTGRSVRITDSILARFDHPVVCASFCRRFRPKNLALGVLAACHLDALYQAGGTWKYQNQSTGISNFQTTHFLVAEKVVLPPEDIAEKFYKLISPFCERMTANESLTLAQIRDTLLPKLISGDLRIMSKTDSRTKFELALPTC